MSTEMDILKKTRKAEKIGCTRCLNSIKGLLQTDEPDWTQLNGLMSMLNKKAEILEVVDRNIFEMLLSDSEVDEKMLEDEVIARDDYYAAISIVRAQYDEKLKSYRDETEGSISLKSAQTSSSVLKQQFKLPTIEWTKFSGDIKDWLRFWSQFKRVHDDPCLEPEAKFQYLIQATTPGSRARELVESYPPTKENYVKAIGSLKSRFGREDLLVETYQRELLKLVVQNILQKGKASLIKMYDKIETQIRALETLGVTKDKCAGLLYPLVESCLNDDLLRIWQRTSEYRAETAMEKRLDKLMEFLKCEVEGEEKVSIAASGFGLQEEVRSRKKTVDVTPIAEVPTAASLINVKPVKEENQSRSRGACIFCGKAHTSENCIQARNLSMEQRVKKVRECGACYACLQKHLVRNCKIVIKCIACDGRHLPILCPKLDAQKREESKSNQDSAIGVLAESNSTVLLQTLNVRLVANNTHRLARALIDTGSQRSYILKSIVSEMKLIPFRNERMNHAVFGGAFTNEIEHGCYKVKITDAEAKHAYIFEALDQPSICGNIPAVSRGPWVSDLTFNKIQLSDSVGPIEVLIGADFAGRILTGRRISLKSGLVAIETYLGWTVMGKVPDMQHLSSQPVFSVCSMLATSIEAVSKLWELDVLGIEDPSVVLTKKEIEKVVQKHFLSTVKVNSQGRYEVHLPWLPDHPPLPTNFALAKKRLENSMQKLNKTGFFEKYDAVFKEWMAEGIIEEVPLDQQDIQGHYMPHRPVLRNSATTSIRPVFDASARQVNSPSLNQCLSKGINLLELIPSILIKFRIKKFGVVSDIRKAFLQISLTEHDRNFVRFLWVDQKGEVVQYRHARVVFGVTSSPYLLGAVIQYHLEKVKKESTYPEAIIQLLKGSFYCDNCVTSVDSPEELEQFISISTRIFLDGKFELRGWEYTDSTLSLPTSISPVLGFSWDRRSDSISVSTASLGNLDLEEKITKRFILSVAHRIFDPIGFTAPVSLLPKLLLQELTTNWDEEVDGEVRSKFIRWASELHILEELVIPRWFGSEIRTDENWSLHTFSDASKVAFSCAVFLKIESIGNTYVQLVQAKSRVVPNNNKHSIPRLELVAALLGARLSSKILSDLGEGVIPYFWSDSTTVVAWVKREEEWASFVGNRVKEIRSLTEREHWRYIPGRYNPADLPSRGCSIHQLKDSRWWEGPKWLKEAEPGWPVGESEDLNELEVAKERKRASVISITSTAQKCIPSELTWYDFSCSQFSQNVRVLGYIRRFLKNCKKERDMRTRRNLRSQFPENEAVTIRIERVTRHKEVSTIIKIQQLTSREFEESEKKLIQLVQKDHFSGINDPKIRHLAGFYDSEGFIRLKTKITNRVDVESFRSPIILPNKSEVVLKLIRQEHVLNHHVGVQGLLTLIRERYWLLFGRRTAKLVVKSCVVCQRETIKKLTTPLCPLPSRRVEDAPTFGTTGVDLAGPLYVKGGQKMWIVIFTCAVYRAVHLEVASSLSTEGFLLCLRRFIARRGRPTAIYSDNGTNFRGADNAFATINRKEIQEFSDVR